MLFSYAESFHQTTKGLSKNQAKKLLKAFEKFESAWEKGQIPQGLGLTHLRYSFYEFRVELRARVLFQKEKERIYYLLYGSHDDIRRFLKRL